MMEVGLTRQQLYEEITQVKVDKKIRLCLISRYFDMNYREGVGIGRVSQGILEGLLYRQDTNVKAIATRGKGLYSYFFYSAVEIPLRLPVKSSIDVFHALTPIEAMWLPKDKSVVTYHDLFQVTSPQLVGGGMGYSKWKLLVGKNYFEAACRIASRCKRLVCVSQKTAEEVETVLGADSKKIRIIPSGIRSDLEPRSRRGTQLKIGYLGMLDRRKRVIKVIEALKKVPSLDIELLIGGRGLDEAKLRQAAGQDKRINFVGYVADNELVDFYNGIDIFVFPTAIEGYGLPIVEAMACKKPVVILNDAIIPAEIKNRCILVDDYVDLLEELRRGGLDPIYESSIDRNYLFAKSHKWLKTIEAYMKVYQEVIYD